MEQPIVAKATINAVREYLTDYEDNDAIYIIGLQGSGYLQFVLPLKGQHNKHKEEQS